MVLVLIVVTLLCAGFVVLSMWNDTPESLSATYYEFGKYGWIFQVVMLSVGILLWPVWTEVSCEIYHCLCFIACASLVFVAAAPAFRLRLEGIVHYGAAVMCCLSVVLWQIFEGLWDVTLWFAFVGGMLSLSMKDKWCWWMEVAVVGSLLANLWRCI